MNEKILKLAAKFEKLAERATTEQSQGHTDALKEELEKFKPKAEQAVFDFMMDKELSRVEVEVSYSSEKSNVTLNFKTAHEELDAKLKRKARSTESAMTRLTKRISDDISANKRHIATWTYELDWD